MVVDGYRTSANESGFSRVPILPLPYLVLMKYQSGRAQDLADIERMLGQASDWQLAQTREFFGEHRANDLEDLESLIELGRLSH